MDVESTWYVGLVGFEVQLKAYADRVDARLGDLLPPEDERPGPLHAAMRYSGLAPGKRLRPALLLASATACGGDPENVLDAACAVEMVHAFSLIHDDLPAIDNDDLRRGRPTCHVVYGEAVAILAGDSLFALAFEILANGPWEQRALAISLVSRASLDLVRGETQDILSEGQPIDAEGLAFIHRNKTGALIAAACEIGALLASGDTHRAALRLYGQRVGLAFQIVDDVLNETSTPETLGKAAGSDRDRGKATYPALFGLDKSREAARDAVEEAVKSLEGLPGDSDVLRELARFTVERLY
ncbi:polyprenyl synthetase family protein [bacterium]|nr:MAG: polyprenyl synthetase family protein [bacterium]